MKKKRLWIAGLTICAVAAMSMTGFAASRITNVTFSCGPDDDASMSGGEVTSPIFTSNSDQYDVVSYNATSDSNSYKTARTYEIVLDARSGYYFPDENEINVSANGVTQIIRKDTEDSGYSLTVRVKAYPYYKWPQPVIETKNYGDVNTSSIKWDKNGAPKVEYILEWTDQNGEERSRTGSSTGTSLSVSSYNKKYTGSSSDKQNSQVTGFAIRGTGNAGDNNRTAPSEWTKVGSVDPENYDFPIYESWSEATGNTSGNVVNNQANGMPGSNVPGNTTGWIQSGNDWYFRQANGTYATGWLFDGANWYMLDNLGKMQVGWYFDGTNWYYLNPIHDGTYGRMLTGWQTIDGLRYYMNPVSDGTRGAMFVGWKVVDGQSLYFNENHDGTYGRLVQ